MFGIFSKKAPPNEPPKKFPPVPDWKPDIKQPLNQIVERISFYTNDTRDFVVFTHGTVVILPKGLNDADAAKHAESALHDVFYSHPDMSPLTMKDGNILVRYKHDASNVVFDDVVKQYWPEIDMQHQRALTTDEVLITPLGPNKFDDFGKKILFGRCYMFMDAQIPKIMRIERCSKVQS